jgi:hypothetical protein
MDITARLTKSTAGGHNNENLLQYWKRRRNCGEKNDQHTDAGCIPFKQWWNVEFRSILSVNDASLYFYKLSALFFNFPDASLNWEKIDANELETGPFHCTAVYVPIIRKERRRYTNNTLLRRPRTCVPTLLTTFCSSFKFKLDRKKGNPTNDYYRPKWKQFSTLKLIE